MKLTEMERRALVQKVQQDLQRHEALQLLIHETGAIRGEGHPRRCRGRHRVYTREYNHRHCPTLKLDERSVLGLYCEIVTSLDEEKRGWVFDE